MARQVWPHCLCQFVIVQNSGVTPLHLSPGTSAEAACAGDGTQGSTGLNALKPSSWDTIISLTWNLSMTPSVLKQIPFLLPPQSYWQVHLEFVQKLAKPTGLELWVREEAAP